MSSPSDKTAGGGNLGKTARELGKTAREIAEGSARPTEKKVGAAGDFRSSDKPAGAGNVGKPPSEFAGEKARAPDKMTGAGGDFRSYDGSGDAGSVGMPPRELAGEKSRAAGAVGKAASEQAKTFAADVTETAKATARAVKEQTSALAGNIANELEGTADQQKLRGADAISGFARAISTAAGELEQQSPMVAQYVRDAASRVDFFSNNLRSRSVGDLLTAASDLARNQPMLFFAGAVAAGFAASRFFKSSAPVQGLRPDKGTAGRDGGFHAGT
jgi:hypothetical protein